MLLDALYALNAHNSLHYSADVHINVSIEQLLDSRTDSPQAIIMQADRKSTAKVLFCVVMNFVTMGFHGPTDARCE